MIRKLIVLAAVLAMFCGVGVAKKLTLLSFNKGEMADDNSNAQVSLSEENVEKTGDFSMKVDFGPKTATAGSYIAVFKPKKGAWGAYTNAKMIIYNPSDKEVKIGWMIKGGKNTNTPENRKDWPLTLKPGKNDIDIKIAGVTCNDEKSILDLSSIFIYGFWNLTPDQAVTVYISKLYLENSEK